MGIIMIDDLTRVNSDNHCWFVEKISGIPHKVGGEMQIVWETIGFYARVNGAIEKAYDIKLKRLPKMGIDTFIKQGNAIRRELLQMIKFHNTQEVTDEPGAKDE